MRKLFLLLFVLLLFGMIGSISCKDREAQIERAGGGHAVGVSGALAPVPKTGQTTCWDSSGSVISCAGTGQDGNVQAGVVPPSPRFTDNGDGTITDNLTRLIWLKNANCFGVRAWAQALTDANTLNSGECGLTDGSVEGDWYLPNRNQLMSLLHLGRSNPALPDGHPFMNFQPSFYWSSTTFAYSPSNAWFVVFGEGDWNFNGKTAGGFVLPVRGGS
jgi:hypothetical protein